MKTKKLTAILSSVIILSAFGAGSCPLAASEIPIIDSTQMTRGSSNRENVIVLDNNEYYEIFIGCEPIRIPGGTAAVPIRPFGVATDYSVVSEEKGKSITISNGNRQITLTAGSKEAFVDDEPIGLSAAAEYENDDFRIAAEDIEALFSYKVSYDKEKNNVILTITDKTPKAVKNIIPPDASFYNYKPLKKVTVMSGNGELSVSVNDIKIDFKDALPFIDSDGRTQVPIRALSEMLNCSVSWNQAEQLAVITGEDGTVVQMKIGDKKLSVGDKTVQMDCAALIKDERTYIPIRFLSEALGFNVFWEYTE